MQAQAPLTQMGASRGQHWAHAVFWETPCWQHSLLAQAWKQLPQFFGSLLTSTQNGRSSSLD